MYLWSSHKISVSKSCGGDWRKLVRCWCLLCRNWFHNHCSLSIVRVAMWFPFWSKMLASEVLVCIVGLLTRISLSGLHSWMEVVRLVILSGGYMNLLSFDWTWVRKLS